LRKRASTFLFEMEHTSLSDALISLIPTYGPWIIFGIVALAKKVDTRWLMMLGLATFDDG
jgi:hypothetical protein